ncbi:MAG: hypothetical protein IKA83_09170 [Paludibacteraceae bacterium]|nr:hypothetical protein [Paludibacteraceae bacterium]
MSYLIRSILLRIRALISRNREKKENIIISLNGEDVQHEIIRLLQSEKPCMIARFGSVELQSVIDYLYPATFRNIIPFLKHKIPSWGYAPSTIRTMYINAGFFPSTRRELDRFGKKMIESIKYVDMLGSWRPEEIYLKSYIEDKLLVPLADLEPYYFEYPWTVALEGKKVLVIHPFEDSILAQYKKWGNLFNNQQLQPNFKLLTLRAVQSIAGNKPDNFNNWFEALDWMKYEIDKLDFDIAIIGCGAYGFPLAAYVKQIGKKAIHLGGAVQYLFGIKSKAFDNNNKLNYLSNEYWVYPNANEVIKNSNLVEGGRYW